MDIGANLKRTDRFSLTVIRANGDIDELGVVCSSGWRGWTPARWRAWVRIKWVNARRGHWRAFWGLPDK